MFSRVGSENLRQIVLYLIPGQYHFLVSNVSDAKINALHLTVTEGSIGRE